MLAGSESLDKHLVNSWAYRVLEEMMGRGLSRPRHRMAPGAVLCTGDQ